jgi:hypothetical protein
MTAVYKLKFVYIHSLEYHEFYLHKFGLRWLLMYGWYSKNMTSFLGLTRCLHDCSITSYMASVSDEWHEMMPQNPEEMPAGFWTLQTWCLQMSHSRDYVILLIRLAQLHFELNALCKINPTYRLYYPGFYCGSVTTVITHTVISGWCVSTLQHLKASN